MAAFLAIQQEVQRRLIDLPADLLADIPTWIKRSQRDLEVQHNFRVMRAEHTANTATADHSVGALPSNWKAPRGRPWYRTQAGDEVPVEWVASKEELSKLGALNDPNDKGAPDWLFVSNTDEAGAMSVEVYPYPDGLSDWTSAPAGEYRLVVPYWKYLAELSAGTDTNWFTNNAEEYLIAQAVGHGFMANWDEGRSAVWFQRAQIAGRKAKSIDAEAARMGRDALAPRADVYGSPRRFNNWRW